jgi:hypothetical protein
MISGPLKFSCAEEVFPESFQKSLLINIYFQVMSVMSEMSEASFSFFSLSPYSVVLNPRLTENKRSIEMLEIRI